MKQSFLALLVVSLLAGCGGDSEGDIAERLESKGTTELLEQAAEDHYSPPADNRLSESQVGMYVAVRERELKIAEVSRQQMAQAAKEAEDEEAGGIGGLMAGMEALGSVADLVTADIRAAQELGYNTAEYQWIKERVLEASADAMREQAAKDMAAMLDQQQADAQAALANATTDEERQFYQQTIEGIEQMRASTTEENVEPWIVHNRELLAQHEGALKALEVEITKYAGPQTDPAQDDGSGAQQ